VLAAILITIHFSGEFIRHLRTPDGAIICDKVLKFNSGSEK
jgi:hypothetical protein